MGTPDNPPEPGEDLTECWGVGKPWGLVTPRYITCTIAGVAFKPGPPPHPAGLPNGVFYLTQVVFPIAIYRGNRGPWKCEFDYLTTFQTVSVTNTDIPVQAFFNSGPDCQLTGDNQIQLISTRYTDGSFRLSLGVVDHG